MINAAFVTAGRAEFTIDNGKGQHFTFRVTRAKKSRALFVSHVSAGKHYMGILTDGLVLKLTAKTTTTDDAIETKVFRFAMRVINGATALPEGYSVRHVGKCGRCGRKLTDPVSIASGIGPDCAKLIDAERAASVVDESASIKRSIVVATEPAVKNETCNACDGSGVYQQGGGRCFRCEGKGHQTVADRRRNYGYDNYYRRDHRRAVA